MNRNNNTTAITQDELMDKIKAAIKPGHADDKRTEAKWGLFRGLEMAPLSQEMIDILYEKDDVVEEMLEFVIEQSAENFDYSFIDFSTIQTIACEYLDDLEYQMLSKKLHERAEGELDKFVQDLKTQIISPDFFINDDSIINKAYQLTIKNEMLAYFEDKESFDTDELRALLTMDKPLDYLYNIWTDSDFNIKDSVMDCVIDAVCELERKLEDDVQVPDDENEDDMEL